MFYCFFPRRRLWTLLVVRSRDLVSTSGRLRYSITCRLHMTTVDQTLAGSSCGAGSGTAQCPTYIRTSLVSHLWYFFHFFLLNSTPECPEPRYGRPPKFDPYVDEDGQRAKKYFKTPPHISVSPLQPTLSPGGLIEKGNVMGNQSPTSAPIPQ